MKTMTLKAMLKKKPRIPIGIKASFMIIILTVILSYVTVKAAFLADKLISAHNIISNMYSVGRTVAQLVDQDDALHFFEMVSNEYDALPDSSKNSLKNGQNIFEASSKAVPMPGNLAHELEKVKITNNFSEVSFVIIDKDNDKSYVIVQSSEENLNIGNVIMLDNEMEIKENQYYPDMRYAYDNILADSDSELRNFYIFSPFYYTEEHDKVAGYVYLVKNLNEYKINYFVFLLIFVTILVVIMFFFWLIASLIMKAFLISPIKRLAKASRSYAKQEDKLSETKFFQNINFRGNDELTDLRDAMAGMESELYKYMVHLKDITAEKERVETELEVASKIQMDMLPYKETYNDKFRISSFIKPAKEVGGDFYDYFKIDDDKVAIVAADVSGKGVPAALFMAVSKSIIKSCIIDNCNNLSLAISKANTILSERNEEMMFVTVFAGIYSIKESTFKYINAGHENPIVYKKDKSKYEFIIEEHDTMLGINPNLSFNVHSISVDSGDKVFIYTDGVTDAINKDDEMFGTDGIINTLNNSTTLSGDSIISMVWQAASEFQLGCDQFDDMTMLLLEIL